MKKYIILIFVAVMCSIQLNAQWGTTGNAGTAAGTNYIGTTDNNGFSIRTWGNPCVRVQTDCDVGIGTTSPTGRLHVAGGNVNFDEAYSLTIGGTPVLKADHSDGSIFGGQDAGNSITLGSGLQNTAFGYHGLYATTTGDQNSAFGYTSLPANTTGSGNTAIGYVALNENSSASGNTAVGAFALDNITTSTYISNVGVGYLAGAYYTATECTFVGAATQSNADGYSNSSAFGYGALITGDDMVRIGNSNVNSIGGYANWTNVGCDKRYKKNINANVPGLQFINKLRPVTYTYDLSVMNNIVKPGKHNENSKENIEAMREKEKIVYTGLLAQEVEQAASEINYDFCGVEKPKNENDLYGIRFSDFVPPMIKAIQELSISLEEKNAKIVAQQGQIDELKTMISTLFAGESRNVSGKVENENVGLKQNQPNPFSEKTTINYTLPVDAGQAVISVYSINGKEIGNYPVSASSGTVEISAKTLSPGNYIYKLIVNDVIIDSKIMTITR